MKDIVKKAALFGVGVAAMSQDQINKFVKQLEKRKIINVKEGKKLVNELLKESKKSQKSLQSEVEKQTKAALAKILSSAKKDLAALEKKLKK